MGNYYGLILAFWPFLLALALLGIGGIGVWLGREHDKELEYRRAQVGHVLVTDLKRYHGMAQGSGFEMLATEVVLSVNRLHSVLGRLKQLFGGEVKSYYLVMTRARQEALIRLMEQAAEKDFNAIANLRMEPVDVAGVTSNPQRSKKKGLYIAILAYGVAYRREEGVYPPPAPPTLQAYPQ